MLKLIQKLLLKWEKMISAERHNQMLLFRIETELIYLSHPWSDQEVLDKWAQYKKTAAESYWDLKNRVKSSNISLPGRWILLREIDERMARFMGK